MLFVLVLNSCTVHKDFSRELGSIIQKLSRWCSVSQLSFYCFVMCPRQLAWSCTSRFANFIRSSRIMTAGQKLFDRDGWYFKLSLQAGGAVYVVCYKLPRRLCISSRFSRGNVVREHLTISIFECNPNLFSYALYFVLSNEQMNGIVVF